MLTWTRHRSYSTFKVAHFPYKKVVNFTHCVLVSTRGKILLKVIILNAVLSLTGIRNTFFKMERSTNASTIVRKASFETECSANGKSVNDVIRKWHLSKSLKTCSI